MMKKRAIINVVKDIESEQYYDGLILNEVFDDFDLDDDTDWYEKYDVQETYPDRTWYEGDPMKISEVENILHQLKAAGCTHVSIIHHNDHNNHVFSGCEVKVADDVYNKYMYDKEMERLERDKAKLQSSILMLEKRRKKIEKKFGNS